MSLKIVVRFTDSIFIFIVSITILWKNYLVKEGTECSFEGEI